MARSGTPGLILGQRVAWQLGCVLVAGLWGCAKGDGAGSPAGSGGESDSRGGAGQSGSSSASGGRSFATSTMESSSGDSGGRASPATGSSGTTSAVGSGGASPATGGASSAGGTAGGASGGTGGTTIAGSGGSGNAGAGSGGAGSGGAVLGGAVDVWYEAEAPENTVDNGASRAVCTKTCTGAFKPGDFCCVGGGWLKNLLGKGGTNNAGGGVTFPAVTVPSAGVYDVEWWYHCGDYDHWHNATCGGPPYPDWLLGVYDPYAEPQPGCRAHLISVNGELADGPDHSKPFWHFPCFGSTWDILRVVTMPLYLAAGKNVVRLNAPHNADLDSVDLDAMHVVTPGKGMAPRIPEGRTFGGDGGRK